ncbi:ferredoxin [Mycolicibacterium sp. XJ870]
MSEEETRRLLHVDPGLCEGHALCIELAPDVFDLSDDEVAGAAETPPREQWDSVDAAVDACPRQAITFSTPRTKGSPRP